MDVTIKSKEYDITKEGGRTKMWFECKGTLIVDNVTLNPSRLILKWLSTSKLQLGKAVEEIPISERPNINGNKITFTRKEKAKSLEVTLLNPSDIGEIEKLLNIIQSESNPFLRNKDLVMGRIGLQPVQKSSDSPKGVAVNDCGQLNSEQFCRVNKECEWNHATQQCEKKLVGGGSKRKISNRRRSNRKQSNRKQSNRRRSNRKQSNRRRSNRKQSCKK